MKQIFLCSAVIVLSLGLSGCSAPSGTEAVNEPAPPAAADSSAAHGDHAHDDHARHDDNGLSDMEKMKMELAKLSPMDATSAMKQHICPVSGEMLGAMGAPIKVDVDGQQVWICCEGCRQQLLESPNKFLAKLEK